MTEITFEEIELGNAVIDITVSSHEEDVAGKMIIDLRDRAYRVSQAMGTGVHPDKAESHPISVRWDDVLKDRFEEGDQDV